MKITSIIAALVLGIVTTTSAFALVSERSPGLAAEARSAINGLGQLNVTVDGDTVILSGWSSNYENRKKAERAIAELDGVSTVINTVRQSR